MASVASIASAIALLASGTAAGSSSGFCCWAAGDAQDVCGSCLPAAVAGPTSYCSESRAKCLSCSSAATWCEGGQEGGEASAGTEPLAGYNASKRPEQPLAASAELLLRYGADEAPEVGSKLRLSIGGRSFEATVVEAGFEHDDAPSSDAAKPEETTTSASEDEPAPKPGQMSPGAGELVPSVDAVKQHGRLSVRGNTIVGEHGMPVRLRGMSLFWSQWMGKYWNADIVRWLKNDWRVTLIRAAMGVSKGGFLENPDAELAKLEAVVDACIEVGIYVVIDWHDYHADGRLEDAKAFFERVARKYGDKPNVLFETFNEPQQISWEDRIEPYHEQVVEVIRKHSNNVIILGTRTWSQEVDVASLNPVPGKNLAYTIHFYAASMGQDLRDKVSTALGNGAAIFATEWGTCEYTGDGRVDLDSSQAWLDFLEENHISDANWAISDKAEACSALREGASSSGRWSEAELTESGTFVRASIREYNSAASGSGLSQALARKHSVPGRLRGMDGVACAAPTLLVALAALAAAAAAAVAARWLRAAPRSAPPAQTLRRHSRPEAPSPASPGTCLLQPASAQCPRLAV